MVKVIPLADVNAHQNALALEPVHVSPFSLTALNGTTRCRSMLGQMHPLVVFQLTVPSAILAWRPQWLRALAHRARPERYTAQVAQYATIVEGSRSYPSGHASIAFAAATVAASILQRRGELRQHRVETLLLFSAAAATSVLRVTSHRHFPTDVVGGAVIGSAFGWFVPQLHGQH
jgi:membrane-associated phospholipid phosphatase